MSEEVLKYIEELERLARIGKATEKAFEEWLYLESAYCIDAENNGMNCIVFNSVQELINWAESEY